MSIEVKDLTYIYNKGTPIEKTALQGINLSINDGEFIGIVGENGSGKSTLIQHFNGLLSPCRGSVIVNGVGVEDGKSELGKLRRQVGLVFQFPEHQFFAETVYEDIAYGPREIGLSEEDVKRRVERSMSMVNLDFEIFKEYNPFKLSHSQQKKVAIAGVLAMRPSVLILDEPTAGLDYLNRKEILEQIQSLYQEFKITVIIVSHNIDEIASLIDKLFVLNNGQLVLSVAVPDILSQKEAIEGILN